MKKTAVLSAAILAAALSQASTIYYQDFSGSSPVSDTNGSIADNTLIGTNLVVTGEVITGGSAASQSLNGDYTITMGVVDLIAPGNDANDGYIFNETGDAGFHAYDIDYTFESGSITFNSGGTDYTGTISLWQNVNVGQEFFSINSLELFQDDSTGEVYIDIDYNFFADPPATGNDDFELTTTFGLATDAGGFDILTADGFTTGNNFTGAAVHRYTLVAVPEPATLGMVVAFGGGILFIRRRFMM